MAGDDITSRSGLFLGFLGLLYSGGDSSPNSELLLLMTILLPSCWVMLYSLDVDLVILDGLSTTGLCRLFSSLLSQ